MRKCGRRSSANSPNGGRNGARFCPAISGPREACCTGAGNSAFPSRRTSPSWRIFSARRSTICTGRRSARRRSRRTSSTARRRSRSSAFPRAPRAYWRISASSRLPESWTFRWRTPFCRTTACAAPTCAGCFWAPATLRFPPAGGARRGITSSLSFPATKWRRNFQIIWRRSPFSPR